jgi:Second Messenger Oligonucleotide or Dinucleotide Synthetase domain
VKLPHDFEKFNETIVLGKTQRERIDTAAGHLTKYLRDWYGLNADDVFEQGSYPNETAVKPDPERSDGEYDVDVVCVCAAANATENDALDDLEAALDADGGYSERIERDNPQRPCIRLRYADDEIGGFHVDVVPARAVQNSSAPLEIPRRDSGWRESAPEEYTQWCRDQGEDFARTVQMLKRWRDHNQSVREAIKSIVLQVVAAENMPAVSTDAERIAGTLRGIANFLLGHPDEAPLVNNPVLPFENLTDGWQPSDYKSFRDVVIDAADRAEEALGENDLNRSRELWRELFGNDFPGPEKRGSYSPPPPPTTGRKRPQKAPRRVEWG